MRTSAIAARIRSGCACLAASALLACPIGPFSGGRLGGEVRDAGVTDWSFVDGVELCQIETNPDDPHSVNTWCAGHGEHLYVPSSMIYGPLVPSERGWVANVEQDPRVRVRIDGVVFERKAARVTDDLEYQAVRTTLEKKYELGEDDVDPEREIWVFRMEPR